MRLLRNILGSQFQSSLSALQSIWQAQKKKKQKNKNTNKWQDLDLEKNFKAQTISKSPRTQQAAAKIPPEVPLVHFSLPSHSK